MEYCRSQNGQSKAAAIAALDQAQSICWPRYEAVLFDLDGVVTRTANLHAVAWQCLFNEFLKTWSADTGAPHQPFDITADYLRSVDGKPRLDGIRSFLQSRGIELEEGAEDDPPEAPTIHGLANQKNRLFLGLLQSEGVDIFPGAIQLVRNLRDHGKRLAVVSSSKNCGAVLAAAGLGDVFDVQVDGHVALQKGLRGKPEPDSFFEAAHQLGVEPRHAIVIEDSVAGVKSGRAGQFGFVVGVDRHGSTETLLAAGADLVVSDLSTLAIGGNECERPHVIPALPSFDSILAQMGSRRPAVFLDYDGTLTPIVPRPELAVLDEKTKAILQRLASLCPVAVISGRARSQIEQLVGVPNITYAGSHGFDISASDLGETERQVGAEHVEAISSAATLLKERLRGIEGVIVEDKVYSVAVHYRLVAPDRIDELEGCVEAVLRDTPGLRRTGGKKVFELRPDINWDKGRALDFIFNALGLSYDQVVPIYLGDDVTDFDAYRTIKDRGVGIWVGPNPVACDAHYHLKDPTEVGEFLQCLADQLESDAVDPRWLLRYDGCDHSRQGLREALCTLGNGYFATRGAPTDVVADDFHYPGTYLAGCYDRLESEVSDHTVENEDLVNIPNWLSLQIRLGEGPWLHASELEQLEHVQELDLKRGILTRKLRLRDADGHIISWLEKRLVSMAHPHRAALRIEISVLNAPVELWLRSALDGTVTNRGVKRYRKLASQHLETIKSKRIDHETILLHMRTVQSRREIALAARTRLVKNGAMLAAEQETVRQTNEIAQIFACELLAEEVLAVEKTIAIFDSRAPAISGPESAVIAELENSEEFAGLARAHTLAWADLWRIFEIAIETTADHQTEMKLHLHIFHLLQTVSPHSIDLDVGVPARGWHGEAYRGHVFWDELFIFPFVNLRAPIITRALLLYRYRRLPEARRAAQTAGYRGAMFPWQSAASGREETQRLHLNPLSGRWLPDVSHLQRHVNAAIVYNVWQYFQVTEDIEFLATYGAELMLEVARFWASLAQYDSERQRYTISGVMGPDEFHTALPDQDPTQAGGLSNNAYTNVMASWCITRSLDAIDVLPDDRRQHLFDMLELSAAELEQWDHISRNLFVPFGDGNIILQFEGYEALEELSWSELRESYGNLQRVDRLLEAEHKDPNQYKVSKQADVLMLFFLFSTEELKEIFDRLGYHFSPDMIGKNIQYYTDRTSHGSTLSWATHAWILSRWDRKRSWRLFEQALGADIDDLQQGTTAEGIHLGAMAGSVDLIQRCYTGIEILADTLRFNPLLPDELNCLRTKIRYRSQTLNITVTHHELTVASAKCTAPPITIAYRGHVRKMSPGQSYSFRLVRAVKKGEIAPSSNRVPAGSASEDAGAMVS